MERMAGQPPPPYQQYPQPQQQVSSLSLSLTYLGVLAAEELTLTYLDEASVCGDKSEVVSTQLGCSLQAPPPNVVVVAGGQGQAPPPPVIVATQQGRVIVRAATRPTSKSPAAIPSPGPSSASASSSWAPSPAFCSSSSRNASVPSAGSSNSLYFWRYLSHVSLLALVSIPPPILRCPLPACLQVFALLEFHHLPKDVIPSGSSNGPAMVLNACFPFRLLLVSKISAPC